jgi:hypothetical protein
MSSRPTSTRSLAEAPGTGAVLPPPGLRRVRDTLLAVLLFAGAATAAAMVLWQPWGERNAFDYADLAPLRDTAWVGALLDGLGIATAAIALGLVACRLAWARGAALATAGSLLCGLGGVLFCAGITSFGVLAWYATAAEAVPVASGTALLSHAEANPGHLYGLSMAGFLLFTVGSLVLMVALWRSRTVPVWLPIGVIILTVGVFAASGTVLNVIQAVQMLLIGTTGWFLLRTPPAAETA